MFKRESKFDNRTCESRSTEWTWKTREARPRRQLWSEPQLPTCSPDMSVCSKLKQTLKSVKTLTSSSVFRRAVLVDLNDQPLDKAEACSKFTLAIAVLSSLESYGE